MGCSKQYSGESGGKINMNEFLFNLILALIPVIAIILTFVVTKIAGKYGKNLDYAEAMYWTKIAVAIIEDKYG